MSIGLPQKGSTTIPAAEAVSDGTVLQDCWVDASGGTGYSDWGISCTYNGVVLININPGSYGSVGVALPLKAGDTISYGNMTPTYYQCTYTSDILFYNGFNVSSAIATNQTSWTNNTSNICIALRYTQSGSAYRREYAGFIRPGETYSGSSANIYACTTTPAIERTVTLATNPADKGILSGAGTYYDGDDCTISYTEGDETYRFVNWSGSATSTYNPYTFTVSEDASFTANLEKYGRCILL